MAAHYRFDVRLYRRPANAADGPLLEGVGDGVPTLTVPVGNQAEPMAITFEEAIDRLAALPGCYAEPDGSIVWTESTSDGRWQVDGNLYDRGGNVIFVSLTGHCPPEAFNRLLACFGWPEERMMLELVRAGVFLGEDDFRRVAAVS
jgi:hypothetical protein